MTPKIIAHRGNIDGPHPELENAPGYLEDAVNHGFDIEVDVRILSDGYNAPVPSNPDWLDYDLFLGHDRPIWRMQQPGIARFIEKYGGVCWFHAKDPFTFRQFRLHPLRPRVFFHDRDLITAVSNSDYLWGLPEAGGIHDLIVMNADAVRFPENGLVAGLCTDWAYLASRSVAAK